MVFLILKQRFDGTYITAVLANLSNVLFDSQSFKAIAHQHTNVLCGEVPGVCVCEEVLLLPTRTHLKHVPHSALGQVEPAPVGLRGVHLLRLWRVLLRGPER